MLIFGTIKVEKNKFFSGKKTIKIWDFDIDKIVSQN